MVLLVALIESAGLLFALLIPTLLIYLFYRAIRAVIVVPGRKKVSTRPVRVAPPLPGTPTVPPAMHQPSSPHGTQQAAKRHAASGQKARRLRRQSWRQRLQQHLAAKTMRQRVNELVGGMLVATVVAAISSLIICMIAMRDASMELYVWMTLVATLASWAYYGSCSLNRGQNRRSGSPAICPARLWRACRPIGLGNCRSTDDPHAMDRFWNSSWPKHDGRGSRIAGSMVWTILT